MLCVKVDVSFRHSDLEWLRWALIGRFHRYKPYPHMPISDSDVGISEKPICYDITQISDALVFTNNSFLI